MTRTGFFQEHTNTNMTSLDLSRQQLGHWLYYDRKRVHKSMDRDINKYWGGIDTFFGTGCAAYFSGFVRDFRAKFIGIKTSDDADVHPLHKLTWVIVDEIVTAAALFCMLLWCMAMLALITSLASMPVMIGAGLLAGTPIMSIVSSMFYAVGGALTSYLMPMVCTAAIVDLAMFILLPMHVMGFALGLLYYPMEYVEDRVYAWQAQKKIDAIAEGVTFVNLSHNHLDQLTTEELIDVLKKLPDAVTQVDLSNNNLDLEDEIVAASNNKTSIIECLEAQHESEVLPEHSM